jgi:transcriptional regulator with XRE-family HTH domain
MASHRADTYNPPFTTFGEFLQYLRRQAGLTQRDLGLAVGYSITHISLLENGKRRPHPTIVAALFVSALGLQNKPLLAEQLVQLASLSHDAINAEDPLDTAEQMSGAAPTIMNTVWSVHHNPLNGISSLPVPSPLLPLIGRNQDLISIVETLADPSVRLLTLVGPPGVGKTRLAIQVCWEIQNSFADGVHFVDLADVHDPAQVRYTIMQVLDPARALQAEDDISHRPLQQFVADKHMVLVLDNFEHLLPASLLVTELLESALQLKILTTSREPLQIYGEYEIQISPLSIPDLERFQI